jgi:hypothetical protein
MAKRKYILVTSALITVAAFCFLVVSTLSISVGFSANLSDSNAAEAFQVSHNSVAWLFETIFYAVLQNL